MGQFSVKISGPPGSVLSENQQITVTEIIHQVFADHLKTLVADVANQATDRLSAQIETGRREIAAETDHAKIAASKLVNDAGAWSAEKLKEASTTAADEVLAAVTSGVAAIRANVTEATQARRGAIWAAVLTVSVGASFLGGGVGFWLAGK